MFLSMGERGSLFFHGIRVIQTQARAMGCYPTMPLNALGHMRFNIAATWSWTSWEA